MLTKQDLGQIKTIVQEETTKIVQSETPKIVREETYKMVQSETCKIVRSEIKPIKEDVAQIRRDIDHLLMGIKTGITNKNIHLNSSCS
jgi:hypothetical protein